MWLEIVARSRSELFVLLSLKYSPTRKPSSGLRDVLLEAVSGGDCGYRGEPKWWRKKAKTVPEPFDRLFIEVDRCIVRVAAHTAMGRARWLRAA